MRRVEQDDPAFLGPGEITGDEQRLAHGHADPRRDLADRGRGRAIATHHGTFARPTDRMAHARAGFDRPVRSVTDAGQLRTGPNAGDRSSMPASSGLLTQPVGIGPRLSSVGTVAG